MNKSFFRKRVFLASVSTGHTSYILAEVESSRGGEYKWGHCMLTIADCRRRVQLEFFSWHRACAAGEFAKTRSAVEGARIVS